MKGVAPEVPPAKGEGDGESFCLDSGVITGTGINKLAGGGRDCPRSAPGKRGGGRGEFFSTVQWFSMTGIEK